MRKTPTVVALALITLALAGCSPSVMEGLGHRITFDSSGMVVHAFGRPNAHVGRDGDLAIGGKPVALTPAERRRLQDYYAQARAMMDVADTMRTREVAITKQRIGVEIDALLHRHPPADNAQLRARSERIGDAAATQLCADIAVLGATQDAIAAMLPVFAPYAQGAVTKCGVRHPAAALAGAAPAGHRPGAR